MRVEYRQNSSTSRSYLAPSGEALDVADFRDEDGRGDERDAAQRPQGRDDRGLSPGGHQRPQLIGESSHPLFGLVDRRQIFLQRDLRARGRQRECREPASIRDRPVRRAAITQAMAKQKRLQARRRFARHFDGILPRLSNITFTSNGKTFDVYDYVSLNRVSGLLVIGGSGLPDA